MNESFEEMLTGGHPNSLGRTEEVVELVLNRPERFEELFQTYDSNDEVVRLRVSSAMKRVEKANRALIMPYIDQFIEKIGNLDQASAQWTLAQLFSGLSGELTDAQRAGALSVMKHNLESHDDWIVLNMTMETLLNWSKKDKLLAVWLKPHLKRLQLDPRKSVSARATKYLAKLG